MTSTNLPKSRWSSKPMRCAECHEDIVHDGRCSGATCGCADEAFHAVGTGHFPECPHRRKGDTLRRNQVRVGGSLLEAGTHVRVIESLPGWGEALDRYGVIERVSLAHYKCYVRTKNHAGWVRVEDLVSVRGES